MGSKLSEAELVKLWELHTDLEFATKDAAQTMTTMTEDPHVNHVPVLTGGRGKAEVLAFYSKHFIPKMSGDAGLRLLSRTVGSDKIVDEFVFSFTHDVEMDWILPDVGPTNKKVEVPMVVVVCFEGDKISAERIYWDQASVLLQVGLLSPDSLPISGVEQVRKFEDPQQPSNELIRNKRGAQGLPSNGGLSTSNGELNDAE